jgi:hypothetical protein
MQTLVHEMVHLWQHHLGKPPSRAYHDKAFAAKMITIGLQPTSTGKPGGATTGPHMMDLCIPEGPFDVHTKALVGSGVTIEWYDRTYLVCSKPALQTATGGDGEEDSEGGEPLPPAKKPTSKVNYSCPDKHINAWAKPNAKLLCGECSRQLESA